MKSVVHKVNATKRNFIPTPVSQAKADKAVESKPKNTTSLRKTTGHQRNSDVQITKVNNKPKIRSVVRKIESNTPRTIQVAELKNCHDKEDDSREVILNCNDIGGRKVITKQTDLRAWLNQKKEGDTEESSPNTDSRTVEIDEENTEQSNIKDFKELVHNINTGPSNDTLSKNNNLEMKRCDYRSLTGKNYLNDKIIDEYMYLIKERNQKENLPEIGFLPVHLFKLMIRIFIQAMREPEIGSRMTSLRRILSLSPFTSFPIGAL